MNSSGILGVVAWAAFAFIIVKFGWQSIKRLIHYERTGLNIEQMSKRIKSAQIEDPNE